MTDNDEFTHALAPARDMTGHPGHDKLRAYWEVPPGGLNPRTAAPVKRRANGNDIIANLRRAYDEKRGKNNDEAKARRAYELITTRGLTMRSACQTVGMEAAKIREWWTRLGLEVEA